MTDIVWGPEIRVDGKRPEWLEGDHRKVQARNRYGDWLPCSMNSPFDTWSWENVPAIRLPADHPHYSKAPATPERDSALWDRMEALVRELASADGACFVGEIKHEAQAIVAELPKLVDPDLLLAREIVAEEYGNGSNVAHLAAQALSGDGDWWFHTKVTLRAVRKLRALQRGEA